MDAVKFLEERARMCGHGCKNCPAYGCVLRMGCALEPDPGNSEEEAR